MTTEDYCRSYPLPYQAKNRINHLFIIICQMGAYSLLKITISMSLACLPDSNKSISIIKFFSLLGVKVSSHKVIDCICVVYIIERCQEGVKEVSSRVSLEGYLQEVVYDGLIGTE